MSELKQRVVTAAMLIPLVVLGVLYLTSPWLAFGMVVFVAAGFWEWARLVGWLSNIGRAVYTIGSVLVTFITYQLAESALFTNGLLVVAVCWWACATAWVIRYQQGIDPAVWSSPVLRTLGGWCTLIPAWLALVTLHRQGPVWVLLLLVVIWGADVGAYFAGKAFGKHRLASLVSPGKSWEGVVGGLLVIVGVAVMFGLTLSMTAEAITWLVILCVLTGMVSVLGDLVESMWKRRAGLKDSGVLIPGHGGVLDRIDSLTAAAPVFVLGASFSGLLH